MKECVTHHYACDCREEEFAKLRADLAAAQRELEALRAFARDVMQAWPEGDVDGGELQAAAVRHGLLRETHPTAPCCDNCWCAEYYGADSFKAGEATCFKRTELLAQDKKEN